MDERNVATLSLVTLGGLAVTSVFVPKLEQILNWVVGGFGVLLVLGLIVWWVFGDLGWTTDRPTPPPRDTEPASEQKQAEPSREAQ